MEKRKDAAGYQHQCFTMMVLLNVIIVLFLTFTIVLTQYRVAAAQEAQKFIGTLKVMPERPEQRIDRHVSCRSVNLYCNLKECITVYNSLCDCSVKFVNFSGKLQFVAYLDRIRIHTQTV